MPIKESIAIFWFRRDLRFDDNIGLLNALDSKYVVLPIFIFDTDILQNLNNKSDARVHFIYDQILRLKNKLEDKGSSLLILHDSPKSAFKKLIKTYDVKKVFANRDYEPYAISRDQYLSGIFKSEDIEFNLFKDHLIFEGNEITKQDGTPFKVFTPYKKVWLEKFDQLEDIEMNSPIAFENFIKIDPITIPAIQSLGFEPSPIKIPPANPSLKTIREYDQKRDFPALNGTSKLGVHFRFGTISIREKAILAKQTNATWLNELIWREFYSSIMQNFPYVVHSSFRKKYDLIPWRNNEAEFQKWCLGLTGYPLVDAGMRELNQTGYMHNRVRMVVASFLTKHLLIDWRWGEAYFAEKLLDFELASNNGGWQWAAGTGTDAQPYFRVFNPESQAAKFDPKMEYIKKWIPEYGTPSYLEPIVEHKSARIRAIETYKAVVSK